MATLELIGRETDASSIAAEASRVARASLDEDVGRGDLTTLPLVRSGLGASGDVVYRAPGVVCGLPVITAVFRALDEFAQIDPLVAEGTLVGVPQAIARVNCTAGALLTGERVALNLLARLAATATLTRKFVDAVAGTRAVILDTRKTTPGLRALEKYAVRVGGGRNHRFGLDGGVLIKDNHLRLAGSIATAIARIRATVPPALRIEVEVEDLGQLEEALAAGADMILLDNMAPKLMRDAVALVAGRVPLEASGGVTLSSVRVIAETGVDFISVGALTHSAGSLDVALDLP